MKQNTLRVFLILAITMNFDPCLSNTFLKRIDSDWKDKPVTEYSKEQKNKVQFTENKGQMHDENYRLMPDVLYSTNTGGLNMFIRKSGVSYQLNKVDSYKEEVNPRTQEKEKSIDQMTFYRLDVNWLGANQNAIQKNDVANEGFSNYYLENCPEGVMNVKSYTGVTLKNIYNQINLHYYEKDGSLKYDFIVAPGGNYKSIRLQVQGADIQKKVDGGILLKTVLGDVEEGAPVVYQNGKELKAEWVIIDNVLSFDIENYDPRYELIIDPVTRVWGTYYGAGAGEYGNYCGTDASGNVYMTGHCDANGSMAMSVIGPYQTTFGGIEDAYLIKFNSNGVRLWDTFYGGFSTERAFGCYIDLSGNVYVTGYTASTGIVMATSGAHQVTHAGGGNDAFLVKFNSNGVRQWGTYYGGGDSDMGYSCFVDASGNIYMSGETNTISGTGIATLGSHQTVFGGGNNDAFLVKFNSNGVRQWGTYYGGSSNEGGSSSCVADASGNVYLSGSTMSGDLNMISTSGSHQIVFGGIIDAFLVKFNSNGVRQWGTYYGGGGVETSNFSCAIDASGNVYISGDTETAGGAVIATSGIHQTTYAGLSDGFLAKFNPNGVRQWGTYLGGNSAEYGSGCCVDASGNVYVSGRTNSSNGSTIATPGSHQTVHGSGAYNAYIMKFNSNGIRQWGTYYGDYSWGIACAASGTGTVYLTGFTGSVSGIATAGSFQSTPGGSSDAFLVKLTDCPSTSSSQTVATCNSYTWPVNNTTYNTSGIYVVTLTNSAGCDSLVILNLTINNSSSSLNITCCNSYTWSANNTTYAISGIYTTVLTNILGCDSVLTLNLTINNNSSNIVNVTACDSYIWTVNNMTYTTSGVYTATLTNTLGCDSVVTLNLTINNSSSSSLFASACSNYTWSINNTTYNTSGTYFATLINSTGCDSTIVLHLTINNSSAVLNVVACDSLKSPSGNYTWTTSGVYIDTIPNVLGCDSIITLNLTINHSLMSSVSISACNNYTWLVNNITYTSGGIYTEHLIGSGGCDSIITLNLTLTNSPNNITTVIGITITSIILTGVTYQWIDCNDGDILIVNAVNQSFTPLVNGTYAVIIDNGICRDTSDCVEITTVGMIENSFGGTFEVYPNPTNEFVSVKLDKTEQYVELLLYSVLGQLLKVEVYHNTDIIHLDVHDYVEGVYLLKIKSNQNKESVIMLEKE